jgi:hypothetical protein
MKSKNLLLSIIGFVLVFSCSKKEDGIKPSGNEQQDILVANSDAGSSLGIKGANWACPGDNYSTGNLVLSGLSSGNSYATNKSFAQSMASQFSSKVGANTIRIPINISTVNTSYWNNYKGVIDGILANGSKVIIAYWHENTSNGYVTDWTGFKNMWTTVCNAYASNSNVYFEIMNEPFGYSTNDLLNMYQTWLSDHSNATRSRVLCGGTGYDDHVSNIGGDSRISGCLYSQHIYAYWTTHTTTGAWQSDIQGRIGSSNYSKTVISEMGCTMNSGLNFYGSSSTNNEVCYFQGVANACRNDGIAACYWPGERDSDSYSMCTRSGSTLTVVNTSGKNELGWAYGN